MLSINGACALTVDLDALGSLEGFFPEVSSLSPWAPWRSADVVFCSPRAARVEGRQIASRRGAQLLVVRPGCLAAVAGPEQSPPVISVLIEPWGGPPAKPPPDPIAALVEDAAALTPAVQVRARHLMDLKRKRGMGLYGAALSVDLPPAPGGRETILIVDVDAYSAVSVIAAARADRPRARVVLFAPEGEAPLKGAGRLADFVIGAPRNLPILLEQVDLVYSGGGLVGLEALLIDRPVICFGSPFWAGWGVCEDRGPDSPIRSRRAPLEAVFAAAYILAARYVDPLTRAPSTPELAFERLAAMTDHARRVAGLWTGWNIPPPKQALVNAFLSGPASQYRASAGALRAGERAIVWAAPAGGFRRSAAKPPAGAAWIEDGFIRSVGLGAGLLPAASLVIDRNGIYYDPATRSDLERILGETEFDEDLIAQARTLREVITQGGLSKYNLPRRPAPAWEEAAGRRRILAPGQVEDDASVIKGGGGWSNLRLLSEVRRRNPDAFIVYKEHPDVAAGYRSGGLSQSEALQYADATAGGADILTCLEETDEVHTLTSLAGFEALLRGKAVHVYGLPFYGGWGLTTDRAEYPRPRRALTLDELVAGVLILYPLYLDPASGLPCDALTFVRRLEDWRETPSVRAEADRAPSPWLRAARAAKLSLKPRLRNLY
jgi:capsular polysaccharide export protein